MRRLVNFFYAFSFNLSTYNFLLTLLISTNLFVIRNINLRLFHIFFNILYTIYSLDILTIGFHDIILSLSYCWHTISYLYLLLTYFRLRP